MPFDRPTIKEITDRINAGISSRLFGKTALLRRAVLRILSRVFAGAIHTSYGYLLEIVKQLFVATATGIWLDLHGRMWKVLRQAGSFASGLTEITGNIGVTLPKGTKVQDSQGIEYETLNNNYFGTTTQLVSVQAVEAGESGNKTDNEIMQMVSPYPGIDNELTSISAFTGGADQEQDEDYRERILQRVQNPPMGGNEVDYETWALEVPEVNQAWSYPLYYGAGTVGVVITAEGVNPVPSSVLLSDVQAYLQDKAPVGSTPIVNSIENNSGSAGTAKIDYSIGLSPNNTETQDSVRSNLIDLFYPFEPGGIILISQVRNAISITGVTDYEISAFFVDGVSKSIADYDLNGFAYPEVDNLTFYDKV